MSHRSVTPPDKFSSGAGTPVRKDLIREQKLLDELRHAYLEKKKPTPASENRLAANTTIKKEEHR